MVHSLESKSMQDTARQEQNLLNSVIDHRRRFEKETSLYNNLEYQRHILNECKRVAEICYLLLYKAGEDGEVIEYRDLLKKTLQELSELPEDEKIELNTAEVQLMCLRSQQAFYEELQSAIEEMKLENESL